MSCPEFDKIYRIPVPNLTKSVVSGPESEQGVDSGLGYIR